MNVVIEGVDGSGKTKLARIISQQVSLEYVDRARLGHGPPKSWEDVVNRLEQYLLEDTVVFDRHTAVSQPIYGSVLRNDEPLPSALITKFYRQKPVIIYARCISEGLEKHNINPDTESPDHLTALRDNYAQLLTRYDEWALKHAVIWYTDYYQASLIAQMVQGAFRR